MNFDQLASDQDIEKTIAALKQNGVEAIVVENGVAAKEKVLAMLPQGAEVMTMSSETLQETGISKLDSVRNKSTSVDQKTKRQLEATPDWAIGSVHAVTKDGKLLIASNTGSQLSAYTYGSSHVIFVVGTQKIVPNQEEGIKRIYDYVLPLESDRLAKVIGKPYKSNVSKLLIINKEIRPGRITVIFVKEKLGF